MPTPVSASFRPGQASRYRDYQAWPTDGMRHDLSQEDPLTPIIDHRQTPNGRMQVSLSVENPMLTGRDVPLAKNESMFQNAVLSPRTRRDSNFPS